MTYARITVSEALFQEYVNHQPSRSRGQSITSLSQGTTSMLLLRFSAAGARVMGGLFCAMPSCLLPLPGFSIERRGGALAMSDRKDQSLIGKAGGDFPPRIAAERPPYG